MQTAISLGDRLAINCIRAYRKWLSPRKGFSCAHRVLHGGPSCSGFVQNTIAQHGLKAAMPLARERFIECKAAGQILRSQRQQFAGPPPIVSDSPFEAWWKRVKFWFKRRFSHCSNCADCSGYSCDVLHCGGGRAADALFDCGPADSGCIDCTPCSCIP